MIITLDTHDLSFENNNFFFIEKIREHYPNFKLSAFFIPIDSQHFARLDDEQRREAKAMIRIAVAEGWLELIPHGLIHRFGEFQDASYKDMEMTLKAYEEYFKDFDVPYVKGFCAPNWLISPDAIKCLDDNGWWLAVDSNQPKALKAKQNYLYNWSIENPFPKDKEVVYGHSHISLPSMNNIPNCIVNLMKIPPDAQWKFVSDIMKEHHE